MLCGGASTTLPYGRIPSNSQDSLPEKRKTSKQTSVPQLSWEPPPISAMSRVPGAGRGGGWGDRVKEYAGELQSSKQAAHSGPAQTLLMLPPRYGEPVSTGPLLQAVGDLRGSEKAPGLQKSWNQMSIRASTKSTHAEASQLYTQEQFTHCPQWLLSLPQTMSTVPKAEG